MTFLAPQFFWLFFTLAVPVWFHLRRRSQNKEVLFSATEYIEVNPARSFSVRIEDLLQLLFKCLCWSTLILGLTQPVIGVHPQKTVTLVDPRLDSKEIKDSPAFWLSPSFPALNETPEIAWGSGFELLFLATQKHPAQTYKVISSPDQAFWGNTIYPHLGTFHFETMEVALMPPNPTFPIYFEPKRKPEAEFLIQRFPNLFESILPLSQKPGEEVCLVLQEGPEGAKQSPALYDTIHPKKWDVFHIPFFPDAFTAKLQQNMPLIHYGKAKVYSGRFRTQESPWLIHPAAESVLRFWLDGSMPTIGSPQFPWPEIKGDMPQKKIGLEKWCYGFALLFFLVERILQRKNEVKL